MVYRDMKNFDEEKFWCSLQDVPWDTPFIFHETDDNVNTWYSFFKNVLDQHAPPISKRVKKKNKPKWLSEDIFLMMRKRDILLKKAKRSRSLEDWDAIRKIRNKINHSIFKAKQVYFKSSLIEKRKNSKKLWKTLVKQMIPFK